MRRILVTVALLSLAGCAPLLGQLAGVGDSICSHETETRLALAVALSRVSDIENPERREIAFQGIQAGLVALDTCPGQGLGR